MERNERKDVQMTGKLFGNNDVQVGPPPDPHPYNEWENCRYDDPANCEPTTGGVFTTMAEWMATHDRGPDVPEPRSFTWSFIDALPIYIVGGLFILFILLAVSVAITMFFRQLGF